MLAMLLCHYHFILIIFQTTAPNYNLTQLVICLSLGLCVSEYKYSNIAYSQSSLSQSVQAIVFIFHWSRFLVETFRRRTSIFDIVKFSSLQHESKVSTKLYVMHMDGLLICRQLIFTCRFHCLYTFFLHQSVIFSRNK